MSSKYGIPLVFGSIGAYLVTQTFAETYEITDDWIPHMFSSNEKPHDVEQGPPGPPGPQGPPGPIASTSSTPSRSMFSFSSAPAPAPTPSMIPSMFSSAPAPTPSTIPSMFSSGPEKVKETLPTKVAIEPRLTRGVASRNLINETPESQEIVPFKFPEAKSPSNPIPEIPESQEIVPFNFPETKSHSNPIPEIPKGNCQLTYPTLYALLTKQDIKEVYSKLMANDQDIIQIVNELGYEVINNKPTIKVDGNPVSILKILKSCHTDHNLQDLENTGYIARLLNKLNEYFKKNKKTIVNEVINDYVERIQGKPEIAEPTYALEAPIPSGLPEKGPPVFELEAPINIPVVNEAEEAAQADAKMKAEAEEADAKMKAEAEAQAEKDRIAAAQADAKIKAEAEAQAEKDRIATAHAAVEAANKQKEIEAAERAAAAKVESERLAAEQVEKDRIAAQAESERLAAEQKAAFQIPTQLKMSALDMLRNARNPGLNFSISHPGMIQGARRTYRKLSKKRNIRKTLKK